MSKDISKEASPEHFRVVIFGSARIKEGSKDYDRVFNLAKMIGENGMDVVTGGGPGLMDAAMSGHHAGRKDDSSHEIGLQIKLPREQHDSGHFDVKKEFERFSDRLDTFMSLANVVVVAPGGIGTTLEFVYAWQLAQVNHTCQIPIILVGKMWLDFMKWVEKWPLHFRNMDPEDLNMIIPVKDIHEAIDIILNAHAAFKEAGPDYCLNVKKYALRQ